MPIKTTPRLKQRARQLRNNLTDAEQLLWLRLRRKQILGVQFYRQRPMFGYIVDFYCAKVGLVVEVDGGQHFDEEGMAKDRKRDQTLVAAGLQVLRFDNRQVLTEIEEVVTEIYRVVESRLTS